MRISFISIRNHSRTADIEISVRRHAVFVGANDVGKSSILRLLNLTLGTSTAGLYQALSVTDLSDPEKPLIVELTLSEFSDAERTLFPREISIDSEDQETESLKVQLRVERDPSDDQAVVIQRQFPEGGHNRAPTREQLESFGWRQIRASRANSSGPLDSAIRTLLESADLGDRKKILIDLLAQFNDQLGKSTPIADLLDRVAQHLRGAMPHEVTSSDFIVQSTTDPDKDVLGNVTLFLNRDGRPVSLHEQSDGLRQLTTMALFDLAEGTANMLAIDEPELHLHPSSQRTIAGLLSGNGNQKIIATHSPFILQRFEPSEVIAIDRDGQAHQVPDSRLSAVNKERANWWSPRLLEALTSRYTLIVEGLADRIIVEAVARALDIDLDRLGAVVLELDGAEKFRHVYPLLGPQGFGVTLLGLVDADAKDKWIGAVGGKAKDVEGNVVFVSHEDLEDEYCRGLTPPEVERALIRSGVCKKDVFCTESSSKEIVKFCRKNKVPAASAIAASLSKDRAKAIESVSELLSNLQARHCLGELF
ncbi:MAG: AAA family ATPase [Actinomycetia bacterium]|nr:AAA family ATPase [Actinomycetes bacterium]